MYLETNYFTNKKGKTTYRYFLRESYWDEGKVKKRTIVNLTGLITDIQAENLRIALKSKTILQKEDTHQGISIGAILVFKKLADEMGITKALGKTQDGKLALWQIISRIIYQSSRLGAVKYGKLHSITSVLKMDKFDENHLYKNLDWLTQKQAIMEKKLFKHREKTHGVNEIFLYDVTSSYFEGKHNELSYFGYNRDKKRGKKQIVIGLLTDKEGYPLSVEVFNGNTSDPKTVSNQLEKIKKKFKAKNIVFVGDRGMIKSEGITDIYNNGYHYITGITKPQINKLIKEKVIEIGLFDEKLSEIESDNIRYVLRLNPVRKEETELMREEKYQSLVTLLENRNKYLSEHPRADVDVAIKKVETFAKKLKISKWIILTSDKKNRILTLKKDENILKEESKLDGCYVLKTDLTKEKADKETVHLRYKDLANVEFAFKRFKTTSLNIRPIHVRKESRTRGHVFVVMLAYILIRELEKRWKDLPITLEQGINELNQIQYNDIYRSKQYLYSEIPTLRESTNELLKAANITFTKKEIKTRLQIT